MMKFICLQGKKEKLSSTIESHNPIVTSNTCQSQNQPILFPTYPLPPTLSLNPLASQQLLKSNISNIKPYPTYNLPLFHLNMTSNPQTTTPSLLNNNNNNNHYNPKKKIKDDDDDSDLEILSKPTNNNNNNIHQSSMIKPSLGKAHTELGYSIQERLGLPILNTNSLLHSNTMLLSNCNHNHNHISKKKVKLL